MHAFWYKTCLHRAVHRKAQGLLLAEKTTFQTTCQHLLLLRGRYPVYPVFTFQLLHLGLGRHGDKVFLQLTNATIHAIYSSRDLAGRGLKLISLMLEECLNH